MDEKTDRPDFVDIDPSETQEWISSIQAVIERDGAKRAHLLLERLIEHTRRMGIHIPHSPNTAYLNTIPLSEEERTPGDPKMERRIRSLVRWNALAMVVQANRKTHGLGGHIASFASAATLYDIGFNHFWHAPSTSHDGDIIYIQGHSAPGIYARAYLEGRISEAQLHRFRQEVGGGGLSSYPHPWLMPNFWQFPTVSMGLSPIMAIYQARFMRYLQHRGILNTDGRKVWAFMGDGEMDEPESTGAIALAARESLDNLIFVINCNLQRLDGPVRGSGKIIQELEGTFRGAGWNVIKVIWGSYWDPLLQRDTSGKLRKRMEEAVDGEYQNFKAKGGAYTRKYFFGKYQELSQLVSNLTDDEIWRLNRGGHDPHKIYAAYATAVKHRGQPTVILAKTVKGYGMGEAGEGQNITHQQKKMGEEALKTFRNRFNIPISDDVIAEAPFYCPPEDSPELQYMRQRRQALGGYLPVRKPCAERLKAPELQEFASILNGSGERLFSTTMVFVRILSIMVRNRSIGQRVVPIVPDEARTFGMEGLFRQIGIYASHGQLYEPQDANQLLFYREAVDGQILEEGINEAGAFSSFLSAATAYANHGKVMLPFYIFYSMFGFQRIGDLIWAAADSQARGFLLGGTSGRTTLAGEGLQHNDGHSQILATTIPNCASYDPTYAYELAVIIQNGLHRMLHHQENVFYYITLTNENYLHPAMPKDCEVGIVRGMYLLEAVPGASQAQVRLLGSGAILLEVIEAAKRLREDFAITAEVWSVTSFTELYRDGIEIDRFNRLHPQHLPRTCYVQHCLGATATPVIAASDYMRLYADQIRPFIKCRYMVLGTDGFGRSDTRENLRRFFEVNCYHIAVAALRALADEGELELSVVSSAIARYYIDTELPPPWTI